MPNWYRSLYWRIGIGFVLFLAAVLAVQGGTLVYLISRMEVGPGQTPPEVTRLVARDLGEALASNPQLDIQQFLRQEYEGRVPLVAIMKDGGVFSTDNTMPPDDLVRELKEDEAIQAADTLLRTIPNQLGVDYNAHVLENILVHVAPELGWR